MLLIAGGSQDFNLQRLQEAAAARDHPFRAIYADLAPPVIHWEPGAQGITINGESIKAAGSSLFIRYDAFGPADPKSAELKIAWFDALKSWAQASESVGLLNRRNETLEVSKPRALVWAYDAGFAVPKTVITNDFNAIARSQDWIAKPVSGGQYTRNLRDIPPSGEPWIVQEKLIYPEMRLFRVGPHYFAFEIHSALLDYRQDDQCSIREVKPPADLVRSMAALTDRMGLDYAAADLKTAPQDGRLRFLEINTMPMFTAYDDVARGRLSDALVLHLRRLERKPALG